MLAKTARGDDAYIEWPKQSLPVHAAEHPGLQSMKQAGPVQCKALFNSAGVPHVYSQSRRDVIPGDLHFCTEVHISACPLW